jgi:hypothetical protein
MKFLFATVVFIAALSLGSINSHAVTIASGGSVNDPNGTVEVGSATDFDFFHTSTGLAPDLTNFNVLVPSSTSNGYTGNAAGTAPNGDTFLSGDQYEGGTAYTDTAEGESQPGVVYFSLNPGSTETSFDLFVLVNNVTNDNGFQTNEVTLTVNDSTGLLGTDAQTFTPADPDYGANSIPSYVEFVITGATSADQFAVTNNNDGSTGGEAVGALTFAAVPEPSTYAMMVGGLVVIGFCVRRKLATR